MTNTHKTFPSGVLGAVLATGCGLFGRHDGDQAGGTVTTIATTRTALSAAAPVTLVTGISAAIPAPDFAHDKFCIHRKPDRTCIVPSADDQDADGFPKERDCNDHDPYTYPGAMDVRCNNLDEDCDGADFCPPDLDGDGFFGPSDCDDRDPNRHPNASEVTCNGIDEDCDGADYCDADGDGEDRRVDCNDRDPSVSPHAVETTCDGVDQDCDGADCCANDADGDGAPCSADCDDTDPRAYPGAPIAPGCYNKDVDCDGIIDGHCG
jgi:hypothetical protein